jgi:hypothetical protein
MEDYIVGYKTWDELQQQSFLKTNIPPHDDYCQTQTVQK